MFRTIRKWLFSDWQHLGIIIQEVPQAWHGDERKLQYFHLFENQYGDRKCELKKTKGTYDSKARSVIPNYLSTRVVKSMHMYQTKVYPWLHGAKIDEIPAYSKQHKHWFVRKLKGKDPMILNDEDNK